ncbi:MAG: DNA mismatch repair endonuclease MutL [Defluviitaleaceae bacterium]|nr:DNA mismatch repair endonuclease MutL [Defluviitaleaceae bacterium]
MSKIIQLDRHLINKIAAGEVVERPLSVVKELTENAIDAGASNITVEIRDGGLGSIRITDNGSGISPANLPLAFARHATSKIADFDDLMSVRTLGFRGEALSSIAAVAQVEMLTKVREETAGMRVEIHGGSLISSKEAGCADGTTLVVSNLFFNTPARRKFLKKPAVEAGYVAHCLERLALGNPALTLRYINNGQIVFQTNGNGDLKSAVLNVYGRETAVKSVGVDATDGEARLFGLAGKPEIARGNRRHGSFFINGRYVESRLVSRAVEAAYKTMLPSGKFPVYALNLTLPPTELDVNVHPTKMDVRFSDEEKIFEFIENALRDALEEHNLIPTVRLGGRAGGTTRSGFARAEKSAARANDPRVSATGESESIRFSATNFDSQRFSKSEARDARFPSSARTSQENSPYASTERDQNDKRNEFRDENKNLPATAQLPIGYFANERKTAPLAESDPLTLREERDEIAQNEPKKFFTDYVIQGLIFQTFWLVSQGESLFVIDRHAAHERVLYENILKKARGETVHSQRLLVPISLRLTPREQQILQDNEEIFTRFGFEIAQNAEHPEIVAVPLLMKEPLSATFFTDILDKMGEVGFAKNSPYAHKTEIVAMAACKAAVKAGDAPIEAEAHALVEQLLQLENPFTCPHGRPTIIEITKSELARRFKR